MKRSTTLVVVLVLAWAGLLAAQATGTPIGIYRVTFSFPSPSLSSKVICGMTMLPVNPRLDVKMRQPVPSTGARSSIRTVQPSICDK